MARVYSKAWRPRAARRRSLREHLLDVRLRHRQEEAPRARVHLDRGARVPRTRGRFHQTPSRRLRGTGRRYRLRVTSFITFSLSAAGIHHPGGFELVFCPDDTANTFSSYPSSSSLRQLSHPLGPRGGRGSSLAPDENDASASSSSRSSSAPNPSAPLASASASRPGVLLAPRAGRSSGAVASAVCSADSADRPTESPPPPRTRAPTPRGGGLRGRARLLRLVERRREELLQALHAVHLVGGVFGVQRNLDARDGGRGFLRGDDILDEALRRRTPPPREDAT